MIQTSARGGRKRILAVDDAATILLRITDTLEKYYEVITVNSGVRALRYLERVKPDLILLDIRMTPKNGFETLREIRDMKDRADIPVIMLTAALADNSSARALAELLADGPLSVEMRDYNRMEKVGPLGADLPANDEWIDAQAGDLILYQGNQLVIYYGANSWSLTRLGRIEGVGAGELRDILGGGDVRVTLSMG